ncbi:MAG: hypothetical protein ACJA14_003050, partial [Ilumatobacter sp.]
MAANIEVLEQRTQPKRTWPQRFLITAVSCTAVASFAAAGLVWLAQQQLEDRVIVALDEPTNGTAFGLDDGENSDAAGENSDADGGDSDITADPNVPVETFPLAEPGARNILITGADNNACLDPNSRFAPAFGDRGGAGERSDTIMMWRV